MRIQTVLFGFILTFAMLPTHAGEDALLRAIAEGDVAFSSEIAVPVPPDPETETSEPAAAAALPLGGSGNGGAGPDDFLISITEAEEEAITDRAFPLLAAKWPFGVVFVCWEDFTQSTTAYRALVRNAVAETWELHSGLEFPGWNECRPGDKGLRIAIQDIGPHVKFLGKFVDGERDGMILNATYRNWSPSCATMLDYCNRVIAVHEFGHAIGFAHEQNRPDTPGDCNAPAQGPDGDEVDLTPWDPNSVMNYCNQTYSNDGVLSEFDIKAVQYIYGRG